MKNTANPLIIAKYTLNICFRILQISCLYSTKVRQIPIPTTHTAQHTTKGKINLLYYSRVIIPKLFMCLKIGTNI